ncbi:MAG TPA: ATP-binding protein, partial [Anaerolineae bacterium]|nr:ATP-binding protein [Anaerolineae bacterium]
MNTTHPIDHTLQQRVASLRWILPIILIVLTAIYELGPGHLLQSKPNDPVDIEILLYGVVSPLLAFWTLTLIGRWLEKTDRAEKQAQAIDRRLASILSASADAILVLDPEGRIDTWNRGAEELFGYSTQQIKGQPLSDLFGKTEAALIEVQWLKQTVQKAGFVRGYETTCHEIDGRALAIELTATRLTDEQSQPIGMSVILRDVTERKRREEEIYRLNTNLSEQVADRTRELAQKVEELARANVELQKLDQMRTEFVSLVSHQLRAPLTNMRGATERMLDQCGAINATCSRMFSVLDQQVDRLDRLVQDVLSATRIEAGELTLQSEPISVLPIVQQIVDQTRSRHDARSIHLPTKPGLPLVFADRDRVAEVLANLLDNADKYSPHDREIDIDVQADQTEVTITVRDFGKGLPPNDLDRIFDKFYRADNSDAQAAYGYGLGLYVCRRLIEAQGG